MEKREARRDRTWRYGRRARDLHLKTVHPNGVVDCVCERSVWFFAKGKSLGCRGSKKGAYGTSKLGTCCKGGFELRETVLDRHRARATCRDALREIDALDFEG